MGHYIGLSFKMLFRTLRRGVVSIFISPSSAARFWRRLLAAAAESVLTENPVTECDKLTLPSVSPESIFPGINQTQITLTNCIREYGSMPLEEVFMLCQLARLKKPEHIFEIGTFTGATTLQLAANSSAKIFTLDLAPESSMRNQKSDKGLDVYPDEPGIRFKETIYAERITQLLGDSMVYDLSPYYGKFDFVLVDACHEYDYVKQDGINALRLVSPRGLIVWHDYAQYAPGVVRALNEIGQKNLLYHIEATSLAVYQNISAE